MISAQFNRNGVLEAALPPNAWTLNSSLTMQRVPPNVKFVVDDVEQDWAESQPYDYIHCRYMTGSIRDWPRLVRQCYK